MTSLWILKIFFTLKANLNQILFSVVVYCFTVWKEKIPSNLLKISCETSLGNDIFVSDWIFLASNILFYKPLGDMYCPPQTGWPLRRSRGWYAWTLWGELPSIHQLKDAPLIDFPSDTQTVSVSYTSSWVLTHFHKLFLLKMGIGRFRHRDVLGM